MTGWDLPNLAECLTKTKGELSGLENFVEAYPLAALSADKKHFVIIRDFSFHVSECKINITNARAEGEQSHKGMTLVRASDGGGNQWNAILPDSLEYTRVNLTGDQIDIYFGKERKTTNFQEVHKKLWSFYKLTESEILERFHSLENKTIEKVKTERQTVDEVRTDLFGVLKLDDKIDCYRGSFVNEGTTIEVSFANSNKELFDRNLMTSKGSLKKLSAIQNSMVTQLLPLKNETWSEEGEEELDPKAFAEKVKLYAITVFEEGSMELYFKDGNLFWGHEIITRIDSKGNYIDSMIAG